MKKKKALGQIRVADFTWWGVGPYVTKLLGMMGAEVIRIESAERIDPIRLAPPMKPGQFGVNTSGYWNNFNPGKLSITLNLTQQKGIEIAKKLIMKSDIVADNFTPRVMPKLGLGYDQLVDIKPGLIVLSMPVMGRDGPRSNFSAFGHQIAGLSGLNSISGFPGRPPSGTGNALADFGINPYQAATALLAALHYRNRTGKGQFIELAQYEATTCVLGTEILDYSVNNRVQGPIRNRHPHAAPHGAYRCKDEQRWTFKPLLTEQEAKALSQNIGSPPWAEERWCVIAVFTEEEWQGFCRAVGNPSWTENKKFSTLSKRKENEDELDCEIEKWTRKRTPEEVMHLLQKNGVAAGVIQNNEDLMEKDPHLRKRAFYQVREHPEMGTVTYDGLQFKFSESPGEIERAPLMGEHNEYVYGKILGMSEEEINQYTVDGIFM